MALRLALQEVLRQRAKAVRARQHAVNALPVLQPPAAVVAQLGQGVQGVGVTDGHAGKQPLAQGAGGQWNAQGLADIGQFFLAWRGGLRVGQGRCGRRGKRFGHGGLLCVAGRGGRHPPSMNCFKG